MYARTLKIKTEVERIDEAVMLFEESVIPLCKRQSGYQGAVFLADRRKGESLMITLWRSK